jgi:hypothetical protein
MEHRSEQVYCLPSLDKSSSRKLAFLHFGLKAKSQECGLLQGLAICAMNSISATSNLKFKGTECSVSVGGRHGSGMLLQYRDTDATCKNEWDY